MNFDPSNDIILPCKFLLRSDSQFCSGFLYDGKEFMNHERELLEKIKRLIRDKRYRISGKVISPLHIICNYSKEELLDIVTAYIPQKPWWESPTKRGKGV